MKKLYFIPGSQDLYGEECLAQVRKDCEKMTAFFNEKLAGEIQFELMPTVENAQICLKDIQKAEMDEDCVGVVVWMHTFSPAKMWIRGLQSLTKPLLHLHTQANEKLPYSTIDMDFMNLNQAAHGDREFGYILARLNIPHEVVAGYYQHEDFIDGIRRSPVSRKQLISRRIFGLRLSATTCATLRLRTATVWKRRSSMAGRSNTGGSVRLQILQTK